ncbi:hypothetical protein FLL45_20710 [Aliikangiella marina]|uniref:ABC transporter substrate-binding protein n=1 Tax=Aliikangiella marina TaxID=1712262 RepID=A0A545T2X9_9GAMM|nr:ABC transporter substrate binding protein [Aliikangiella marina]TQV71574.1 hypothetical protein FLL45_20710 [Aliikangiella marina]
MGRIKSRFLAQQLPLMMALMLLTYSININKLRASEKTEKTIPVLFVAAQQPTEQLRKALETQLRVKMPSRKVAFFDLQNLVKRDLEQILKNADQCALAIGPEATQRMLSIRQPINHFSILTSRNLLDKLHRVYQRLGIEVTGIYEEQPLQRQLFLAKAINDQLQDIAIILNQKDKYYLPEYQATAGKLGLSVKYRVLKAADSPEKYMGDIADPDTFLMLTNNNQLYVKSKLSALVLAAYYQQIKLIGNRFENAKTGALASIYTPTTTLAIEAISDFVESCKGEPTSAPRYAKSFSVIINQQIANNLNMSNLNANQLSKLITQMENSQEVE